MMYERLPAGRPRMSARLIIDGNDELTNDHPIAKCNDSPIPFELAVDYEPGHQTFMDSSHITDRVPNEFFTALDLDFFVDGSHLVLQRSRAKTRGATRARVGGHNRRAHRRIRQSSYITSRTGLMNGGLIDELGATMKPKPADLSQVVTRLSLFTATASQSFIPAQAKIQLVLSA
jgi:hypothetical protein